MYMAFEYDKNKSDSNKIKHGIDFEEAQALWLDDNRIEAPARVAGSEPRYLVIGRIGGRCWTAVAAQRGQATRIISVRRSRGEEERRYEQD